MPKRWYWSSSSAAGTPGSASAVLTEGPFPVGRATSTGPRVLYFARIDIDIPATATIDRMRVHWVNGPPATYSPAGSGTVGFYVLPDGVWDGPSGFSGYATQDDLPHPVPPLSDTVVPGVALNDLQTAIAWWSQFPGPPVRTYPFDTEGAWVNWFNEALWPLQDPVRNVHFSLFGAPAWAAHLQDYIELDAYDGHVCVAFVPLASIISGRAFVAYVDSIALEVDWTPATVATPGKMRTTPETAPPVTAQTHASRTVEAMAEIE